MSESGRVQRYFERYTTAFDRIYEQDQRSLGKRFDRWRHRSMFERFDLTLSLCGDVVGRRVLDVGCGSGRYAVELARRGATVVGVDFSAPMIALARQAAEQAHTAARCTFLVGDILQLPLEEPFDISLAIGLFDYTREPTPVLSRMRQVTRRLLIASFPVRAHPLALPRKLRLRLKGCPVYFYSQADVERLLSWPQTHLALHPLGRDYLAAVTCESAP